MAKNPRKPNSPSKKHLARVERENLQRRYILIASAVVIGLVVIVVAYGILNQNVFFYQQPVAVVNGQNITTERFQAQTRYARYNLIRSAENSLQLMQMFGNDPNTQMQFAGQLQQIKTQIDPTTVGKSTLDQLTDDALIRQEAKKRNITVSQQDIDKAFQEAFGYFQNGTPTPTGTSAPVATSTLSPLQLTIVPVSERSTPTPQATPTSTATVTTTVKITPTPTATPVLTPTATATPYTLDGFKKVEKETADNFKKTYGINEADLRFVIESSLYREKVMKAVIGELPHTQEQVWARHILVADEKTAKDVEARLKKGEDWTKLAAQFSTDTSNKDKSGDLSWFAKGRMVAEFEKAAFALKVGEISPPVKTNFGYHIIQVLGHENRPLSTNEYDQTVSQAFSDWLKKAHDSSKIDIKDIWMQRVPTTPALPAQVDQILQQLQAAQGQSAQPGVTQPVAPQPTP
jgi:peptidyl-prolyl cis-trans isomerase D